MASKKENLLDWLKNAYAMENAQVTVLEKHAKDAEDYTEVHDKIAEHAEQTKQHAETVRRCVQELGDDVSKVKSTMGQAGATFQNLGGSMSEDKLVKDTIADFAAENLEIASYNSIITAANELGEQRVVQACQKILEQEKAMANWLAQEVPVATREYLREQAEGI